MSSRVRLTPQQYIQEKHLEALIEKAVNALYKEQAENPHAFLAEYFEKEAGAQVIERIHAREILDSRGNPTVEACIYVNGRLVGTGSAPSGASTGSHEAVELRDTENKKRYGGKGVLTAVANVIEKLSPALSGFDPVDLKTCDKKLCDTDGTEEKKVIGANAITAVSFALAGAGAEISHVPLYEHFARLYHGDSVPEKFTLPTPLVNILNGGKHAGGKLKIQEFMIVPMEGMKFRDALRQVTEVYHRLGVVLREKYGVSARNVGDEGGYAPLIDSAHDALTAIETAISDAGYVVGESMFLALDCAASEFYDSATQKYEIVEGQEMTTKELIDYYAELIETHPALISIEDPLDEDDYEGWTEFNERFGSKIRVIGDDLFTTSTTRIRSGLEKKWANALLLKVNQIGTVSEAMEAARMMHDAGGSVAVSHRSGETTSSIIADLAVGIGARYIKTGAVARGERVAKYNRLLQIEEELEERERLDVDDHE
eukprot:TRINITY_DN625_c0_g3_i1.p1 TRINITY_DN625_c0_g3~~TRINITY_DN625_c0_g3_i1.p1  ORF type:complete len:486 (-),score=156.21 TRINITY_DN625_c0_g3_i1:226-1683(-)